MIRFSSGLIPIDAEEKKADKVLSRKAPTKTRNNESKNLCPVLEFRILNHNHHTSMGVIANSELHCLASVEDERDDDNDKDATVTIGNDSRVNLPRRLFITMQLTNGQHPFFRRCWTATHIMDQKSPLLKKKMKDEIEKNNGHWPDEAGCNTAEFIKKNLKFKQIIVNFTGVSKRTSKEVHAQRVYDICDVIVGYQFVNVLQKTGDQVEVKSELMNDIKEQNGDDKGENLAEMMD